MHNLHREEANQSPVIPIDNLSNFLATATPVEQLSLSARVTKSLAQMHQETFGTTQVGEKGSVEGLEIGRPILYSQGEVYVSDEWGTDVGTEDMIRNRTILDVIAATGHNPFAYVHGHPESYVKRILEELQHPTGENTENISSLLHLLRTFPDLGERFLEAQRLVEEIEPHSGEDFRRILQDPTMTEGELVIAKRTLYAAFRDAHTAILSEGEFEEAKALLDRAKSDGILHYLDAVMKGSPISSEAIRAIRVKPVVDFCTRFGIRFYEFQGDIGNLSQANIMKQIST